jgi:uncharacterized membrane protein YphA (DoxX/SURF4 family)
MHAEIVPMLALFVIALAAICTPYLQGGVSKALNFRAAVHEVEQFGLWPASPIAAFTIVTEIGGPSLILTGYFRWLGAFWLATFTLAATLAANRFWDRKGPDRVSIENSFFEHFGLIGLLLVAWYDLANGQ